MEEKCSVIIIKKYFHSKNGFFQVCIRNFFFVTKSIFFNHNQKEILCLCFKSLISKLEFGQQAKLDSNLGCEKYLRNWLLETVICFNILAIAFPESYDSSVLSPDVHFQSQVYQISLLQGELNLVCNTQFSILFTLVKCNNS